MRVTVRFSPSDGVPTVNAISVPSGEIRGSATLRTLIMSSNVIGRRCCAAAGYAPASVASTMSVAALRNHSPAEHLVAGAVQHAGLARRDGAHRNREGQIDGA